MHPDVLVVGAGPAGLAAAISLRKLGHSVMVVDGARERRASPGECLSPKIEVPLATLGVLEEIQRSGFARMAGTRVVCGGQLESFQFDPTGDRRGYQVDRQSFDSALETHARAAGVDVHWSSPVLQATDQGTSMQVNIAGREMHFPFVLDASGSSARIGRPRGWRKRGSVRTSALTGYFSGTKTLDTTDPFAGVLEAHAEGWVWLGPRADGWTNVTVAVAPERGVRAEERFQEQIGRTQWIRSLLSSARLETPVLSKSATRAWCEAPSDAEVLAAHWLPVGDASSVIDPLTSQGVYKALMSGLAAAVVVRTALGRPEKREMALRHHARSERELFDAYSAQIRRITASFGGAPFWRDRTHEWSNGREASSEAARAERRATALEVVRTRGGLGTFVARGDLRVEMRTVAEDGWIVEKACFITRDGAPVATGDFTPDTLLPALDRSLSQCFDTVARNAGLSPSSALGKRVFAALLALAEHGSIRLEPRLQEGSA